MCLPDFQSHHSASVSADSPCHPLSEVELEAAQVFADWVIAVARSRNRQPYRWSRDDRSGMGLSEAASCEGAESEGAESAVGSLGANPCTRDTVRDLHDVAHDTLDEVRDTHGEVQGGHDAWAEVEDMLESVRQIAQGQEDD